MNMARHEMPCPPPSAKFSLGQSQGQRKDEKTVEHRVNHPKGRFDRNALRNLDWNLIRTFHTIVECGGVSNASERLLRTQPAVSAALKRLEQTLDVTLVNRSAQGFVLTIEGRWLFTHSETAVRLFEKMCGLPSDDAGLHVIKLNIASNLAVPMSEIFEACAELEKCGRTIDIHVVDAPECYGTVGAEPNSWLLSHSPNGADPGNELELGQRRLLVYAAPRVAQRLHNNEIDASELPWISVRGSESVPGLVAVRKLRTAFRQSVVADVASFSHAAELAASGLGVAALPQRYVSGEAGQDGLAALPIAGTCNAQIYLSITSPIEKVSKSDRALLRSFAQLMERASNDVSPQGRES